MTINVEMPAVAGCTISDCAYNQDDQCHARAITVGDGVHPGCDTFLQASSHTRERQRIAGVGACKVTGCAHNDDYECMAAEIEVGMAQGSVDCLTYAAQR